MQRRTLALTTALAAATVVSAILIGCATAPSDAEMSAKAAAVMKASFKEQGQAKLDRLDQDDMQKTCSEYSGKALPKDVAERIEKANLASIKWPADGKYVGDWKNGEKIAQSGQGMQYSDDPKQPSGANCYACHQLDAAGAVLRDDRPQPLPVRQAARLYRRDAQVRVRKGLQRRRVQRVHEHAALRAQGNPDRTADRGCRRAADGPGVAGQQVVMSAAGEAQARSARRRTSDPADDRVTRFTAMRRPGA